MGWGATGFLSSHSGNPSCLHTNGSRVSLSFIVWFIALWTRHLRWFPWDAFGLYLSSFTLEAHCKSLMDLGACDCIQFPLYVIVGEKSAVASDCKLIAGKLTGFPAAALRLYFGGKGGVFYLPLKLLNKCWPSKIVYINYNDPPPSPPINTRSGHLKKRFSGITGLICSLVKKKFKNLWYYIIQAFETQLVETRKTNRPGYLHISFQTGPRGEIKKSQECNVIKSV